MYISPKKDELSRTFPYSTEPGHFITGLTVALLEIITGPLYSTIRLFADTGTDTRILICLLTHSAEHSIRSENIIGRRPFQDSGCTEADELIRDWLNGCRINHDKCARTLSGDIINESQEPSLPKRIIKVSPPGEPLRLRLVVTHGKAGRYATLSHCWGPPEMAPLTTTSKTFEAHTRAIDWTKLSKTFRDAVQVTRQVGLRYVWIDSFCYFPSPHLLL